MWDKDYRGLFHVKKGMVNRDLGGMANWYCGGCIQLYPVKQCYLTCILVFRYEEATLVRAAAFMYTPLRCGDQRI